MTFNFPLRARCINGNHFWRRGEEVRVLRMIGVNLCVVASDWGELIAIKARFKPIVRRIAGSIRT